jgi:selenide, water dikinase
MNVNPWCMIGGIASAVCSKDEIVFPTKAVAGDALILTKPLGVQLATNAPIWMAEDSENWKKLSEFLTKEDINEAYATAIKSMTTLNHLGAKLMQKYKAHCATDVTGFGLVGHAENLLGFQESELDFVINKMPVIKHVKKMAEILNRHQKLHAGKMVETSGGLLLSLPSENAKDFCNEFEAISGDSCWIVGYVAAGSRKAILENPTFIEI